MTDETGDIGCRREGCALLTDGVRASGYEDPEDCPSIVHENSQRVGDDTRTNVERIPEQNRVSLHSGLELDAETVLNVSRDVWAKVILIAGAEGSGKTTLLASLYDSFQRGPFEGFSFAGSLTLPAFERLCHLSRIASLRETPETERTPRGDRRRYFHLSLTDVSSEDRCDLLFSDLAGEQFRLVMNSEDECRKLAVARRADHVAVLADGQKLISLESRAAVLSDVRRLLRSLLDCEMIGGQTVVEVLFSKWDLVKAGDQNAAGVSYAERVEEELRHTFSDRVGNLRFLKVAARPQNDSVPFGYGLDTLLTHWARESLFMSGVEAHTVSPEPPLSEFDRFGLRYPMRA